VALGLLLLVMSILGFALWSVQQSQRTPVLVAAVPIGAGEEIQRVDLVLVSVGAEAGLTVLGADEVDQVVGRVARGPIPRGTPLSPALVVSASEAVPAGRAVVGAALAPGEYPTSTLRAGDRVRLVDTTVAGSAGRAGSHDEVVELGEATIWTVEPLDASARSELFVSLLVAENDAASISDVVARDQLRLVLIGAPGGGP
jgi:hypothetical protein